jgi:hypothetical protein
MKWIKKIWNSFVKWFKGLFRKKYSTIKPSGCVEKKLVGFEMTSTGLEPHFEQYYTRRTALVNTDEVMARIEAMYLDPTVEHEPTPEKRRSFIKKKSKAKRIFLPHWGTCTLTELSMDDIKTSFDVVRKCDIMLPMDSGGSMKVIKNRFGKI